ncbi:hypothetical protein H0H93_013008 [Arthromyces matolae]|nr:hypothetical protein H0H93_013008 [Arthromyces matolae]
MSSHNDAPPPYPGPNPFSLISYDDTVAADDVEDSLRLPSYQHRTNARYEPYRHAYLLRHRPPRDPLSRFENTIFDELCTPLEVPQPTAPSHPEFERAIRDGLNEVKRSAERRSPSDTKRSH